MVIIWPDIALSSEERTCRIESRVWVTGIEETEASAEDSLCWKLCKVYGRAKSNGRSGGMDEEIGGNVERGC